jgi:hypothetical protein
MKTTTPFVTPTQKIVDSNRSQGKAYVIRPRVRSGKNVTSWVVHDLATKTEWLVELAGKYPTCSCGGMARTGIPCAEITAVLDYKGISLESVMQPFRRTSVQKGGLQVGMSWCVPVEVPEPSDRYDVPPGPGTRPGRKAQARRRGAYERCRACGKRGHAVGGMDQTMTPRITLEVFADAA